MAEPLFDEALLRLVVRAASGAAVLCLLLALTAIGLRLRNARVAQRWERVEAQWTPLVLDALAAAGPPGPLPAIPAADMPYFASFLTRFARRVRGPERQRVMELATPYIPAVRRELRSRSAETRARAVDTLGLLAPDASGSDLIAALDDPSILVAMVAARALSREQSPEHAETLVGYLHRFRHWRPGFLAAMLSELGPDIAPALRHALADVREPAGVRIVAAEALARLDDLEAADAAANVAMSADDPELRAAALRLLARVGVADHLPSIRAGLDAPDDIVRIAAARALAQLGGADDEDRLVRAVSDPSCWVAAHAARGLARGSGRPALERLAAAHGPRTVLAREILAETAA